METVDLLQGPQRNDEVKPGAMKTTLYALIERSASAALEMQRRDGSMPAGHNGLYRDPETPVRNTSHWLITFLKAYEISGDSQFEAAARRATSYLCSRDARPMTASFWHRKTSKKDTCNGLVGQAWTIEALVEAAETLEMQEAIQVAEEVFLLHPFRPDVALWERVNADGMHYQADHTFNHQLWFAAAGGLLTTHATSRDVEHRVRQFMDRLDRNLRVRRSGLIRHLVIPTYSWKKLLYSSVRRFMTFAFSKKRRQKMRLKEVGYHAFNLYGMALLRERCPAHSFWSNPQLNRALKYVVAEDFEKEVETSIHGYPYNPPGFEVPYALEVFGEDIAVSNIRLMQQHWVEKQLAHCYDFDRHMMCRNTEDPTTHAARLYEATRLPNLDLRLEKPSDESSNIYDRVTEPSA